MRWLKCLAFQPVFFTHIISRAFFHFHLTVSQPFFLKMGDALFAFPHYMVKNYFCEAQILF